MLRIPQIDLRRKAPAFGLLALYAYLAYHAFSGSQGLLSWINYSDQADRLSVTLTERQTEHLQLKQDVDALRNDGLDLDALEIAARRDLYVSDTNEITIWLDP